MFAPAPRGDRGRRAQRPRSCVSGNDLGRCRQAPCRRSWRSEQARARLREKGQRRNRLRAPQPRCIESEPRGRTAGPLTLRRAQARCREAQHALRLPTAPAGQSEQLDGVPVPPVQVELITGLQLGRRGQNRLVDAAVRILEGDQRLHTLSVRVRGAEVAQRTGTEVEHGSNEREGHGLKRCRRDPLRRSRRLGSLRGREPRCACEHRNRAGGVPTPSGCPELPIPILEITRPRAQDGGHPELAESST
jgi:hypothetical protein